MLQKLILLSLGSTILISCASPTSNPTMNSPAAGTVATPTPPITSGPPEFSGSWKSPSPEPAGNGQYGIRELNISGGHFDMTYTLAGDKDMKGTIYVYRSEGTYNMEGPSNKIPGAYNFMFTVNRKLLNLKSKDKLVTNDLGFNTCKSVNVGKEKDIGKTGCAFIKSLKECSHEYDVVRLDSGNLRFGERPPDGEMCTAETRPENLAPGLRKL